MSIKFWLWYLWVLCSCVAKIGGGRRAKEKIGDYGEEQAVDEECRQGVKGAEEDVIGKPSEEKPAGPVAATKDEESADDRDKTDEADPYDVVVEWKLELGEVVGKANGAGCDKQATDECD